MSYELKAVVTITGQKVHDGVHTFQGSIDKVLEQIESRYPLASISKLHIHSMQREYSEPLGGSTEAKETRSFSRWLVELLGLHNLIGLSMHGGYHSPLNTILDFHQIYQALANTKSLRYFKLKKWHLGQTLGRKLLSLLPQYPLTDLQLSDVLMYRYTPVDVELFAKSIRALPTLKALDLSGTAVAPPVLAAICTLRDLRVLNLSACFPLPSPLSNLPLLTHLQRLDLSLNSLSPQLLIPLGALKHVTEINLQQAFETCPEALTFLQSWAALKRLNLSHNPLSNDALQSLASLAALQRLDLSHCLLSPTCQLPALPALSDLDVSHARLSGRSAFCLVQSLQKCPKMKRLNLNHNEIGDSIELMRLFTTLPEMELFLDWNWMSAQAVDFLQNRTPHTVHTHDQRIQTIEEEILLDRSLEKKWSYFALAGFVTAALCICVGLFAIGPVIYFIDGRPEFRDSYHQASCFTINAAQTDCGAVFQVDIFSKNNTPLFQSITAVGGSWGWRGRGGSTEEHPSGTNFSCWYPPSPLSFEKADCGVQSHANLVYDNFDVAISVGFWFSLMPYFVTGLTCLVSFVSLFISRYYALHPSFISPPITSQSRLQELDSVALAPDEPPVVQLDSDPITESQSQEELPELLNSSSEIKSSQLDENSLSTTNHGQLSSSQHSDQ